jgi:hypothetical protein
MEQIEQEIEKNICSHQQITQDWHLHSSENPDLAGTSPIQNVICSLRAQT